MNLSQFKIKFLESAFSFEGKPLKLYDYQLNFLRDESEFRVVRKARQVGMSLIIAAEGLVECLMHPGYTVLFVSTGEDAAKRILDYVYDLINGMPDKLKPKLTVETKGEIRFVNKSKLVSLPNNPKTVRGFRAHRVYVDEAAHFINDEDIFSAIQPSISRGGKMSLLSTPFGRSNKFYEVWDKHELYSKHTIHWQDCPDESYRKSVQANRKDMDEVDFNQEYCCDFASDDMAYLPFALLKPCVDDTLFNITETKTRHVVRMGYDPGGRIDAGCITLTEEVPVDKDKIAVVRFQEEYNRITIPDQMKALDRLYDGFHPVKISIDETSMGVPISEQLIVKYGGVVEPIRFSADAKEAMISTLRILFERQCIRIPNNERLLFQLMNMERTTTPGGKVKYQHAGKKTHDDRVWSLCLSLIGFIGESMDVDYKYGADLEMNSLNERMIKTFTVRGEGSYGFTKK